MLQRILSTNSPQQLGGCLAVWEDRHASSVWASTLNSSVATVAWGVAQASCPDTIPPGPRVCTPAASLSCHIAFFKDASLSKMVHVLYGGDRRMPTLCLTYLKYCNHIKPLLISNALVTMVALAVFYVWVRKFLLVSRQWKKDWRVCIKILSPVQQNPRSLLTVWSTNYLHPQDKGSTIQLFFSKIHFYHHDKMQFPSPLCRIIPNIYVFPIK